MSVPISPTDDVEGSFKNFNITIATEEHYPAILRSISESYVYEDPMCKVLAHSKKYRKSMTRFLSDVLNQNNNQCLVAFDQENVEVAGWRISKIITKAMSKQDAKELKALPEGEIKIDATLIAKVTQMIDVFDKYKVDRIVDYKALFVHEKFRGLGLGYELLLRSMRLAKRSGFEIIRGVFTSKYSKRLAVSLGMEQYGEIFYNDFKYNGNVVYKDISEDHSSAVSMVKEL